MCQVSGKAVPSLTCSVVVGGGIKMIDWSLHSRECRGGGAGVSAGQTILNFSTNTHPYTSRVLNGTQNTHAGKKVNTHVWHRPSIWHLDPAEGEADWGRARAGLYMVRYSKAILSDQPAWYVHDNSQPNLPNLAACPHPGSSSHLSYVVRHLFQVDEITCLTSFRSGDLLACQTVRGTE